MADVDFYNWDHIHLNHIVIFFRKTKIKNFIQYVIYIAKPISIAGARNMRHVKKNLGNEAYIILEDNLQG